MDAVFQKYMEQLHPSYERLLNKTPVHILDLPMELPRQCVYLFSEGGVIFMSEDQTIFVTVLDNIH